MNGKMLANAEGVGAVESPWLELAHGDNPRADRPWAEAARAGEKRVLEMIARANWPVRACRRRGDPGGRSARAPGRRMTCAKR